MKQDQFRAGSRIAEQSCSLQTQDSRECRDHCHCPAPFTYFVWKNGYFHPFLLTMGISTPLISLLACLFTLFHFKFNIHSSVHFIYIYYPPSSGFLRNCFLCRDCWNSEVMHTLDVALLCSSRAGSDLGRASGLVWGAVVVLGCVFQMSSLRQGIRHGILFCAFCI